MKQPRIVVTVAFYAKTKESWATLESQQTMSETLPANSPVERISEVMNDLRRRIQEKYLLDEPYTFKFQKLTFGAQVLRDTIICDARLTTEGALKQEQA